MEQWVLLRKGADFEKIGKQFGISPRLACLVRNREIIGEQEIDKVLCILPDGSSGAPCGACRELMVQLMAGKYLSEESLDPEAIKRINEKYEYLRRIDLHATASAKIRRIFAFIVDWNIIGFSVLVMVALMPMFSPAKETPTTRGEFLLAFFVLPFITPLAPLMLQ